MELLRATRPLLLLLFSIFAAASAEGNETDRLSLLEFKANIIDPFGALNTWNESKHFCEWPGVVCGRRHQRVTSLFIDSSRLRGRLSPFIGNLSFLRTLDLKNNSFSHQIPKEIGRLHRLQFLRLQNNSFNGTIPANISRCFSLQHLFLSNNKLTGEIPSEIGSLPNLEVVSLSQNSLHGEIPSSFANLTNTLKTLDVTKNHLSGHIPSSLGQLKIMEFLSLGQNNFSGKIPSLIYNLSLIRVFSVETNELDGVLPSQLGHLLLPKLELFYFHTNLFSGPVPDISNAFNLISFQVSSNRLSGKVPEFLNLPNLKRLSIDNNNLGSNKDGDLDFLEAIVNCTNLEVLDIRRNKFGGELHEYVGNFSTMLWLMALGRNQIKGRIPNGIGNLVNLEALGFEHNQMTGLIPSSLGKLQKLNILNLVNNTFSGIIPSSFGNLTSLNQLSLAMNNLEGVLPPHLGECKSLKLLSLYRNNLSGSIPKEVLSLTSLTAGLDFSKNHFTGSLPIEVGGLVNIQFIDLSDNKLSGDIPESLGGCDVLEYLSLGRNSLQGSIPKSLSNLKGLLVLDLSHNNLSGAFPTYFENSRSLELADFSFNNLEGEIPTKEIFSNASAIWVQGNSRLCGGIAKLGLPKCPSKSNSKHKQLSKLIIVLVVCGLATILLLASLLLWLLLRTRKSKTVDKLPLAVSFLEVSYGDLLKATNGFCNLIGSGSFGSVYKANILVQNNPLTVAVKVLNLQASKGLKTFVSECKVLGSIKHRNVVKLITACSSIDFQGNDFKALVYEFMTNGSLEEWLHSRHTNSSKQGRQLNFVQRLNIVIDIANALDHLHSNSHMSIVHSDIKPSNILLDSDMTACIGDFGLARFLEEPSSLFSSDQSISLGIRGSIGYIAPEYSMGGELSRAGDVYSYGILLLEMFTGKRPTDDMFKDSFNLHNFVKMSLQERLSEIVDTSLLVRADRIEAKREESREHNASASEIHHVEGDAVDNNDLWVCLQSILGVGVSCSEERQNERMIISDVVKELQHIKITYTSKKIGVGNLKTEIKACLSSFS